MIKYVPMGEKRPVGRREWEVWLSSGLPPFEQKCLQLQEISVLKEQGNI